MDALVVHSLVVRLPRERRAGGRVPFDLSELAIQTAALAAFVALCLLPGPALIRLSFPARLCLWLYASAVDRRPCVTPRDAKRRDSPLARGRSGYLRIGPLETISAGIWCLVGCMEKGDAEKATRGLPLRGGAGQHRTLVHVTCCRPSKSTLRCTTASITTGTFRSEYMYCTARRNVCIHMYLAIPVEIYRSESPDTPPLPMEIETVMPETARAAALPHNHFAGLWAPGQLRSPRDDP